MRGQQMTNESKNGSLRGTTASMTNIGSANLQRADTIAPQGDRQDDCAANRKTLSL